MKVKSQNGKVHIVNKALKRPEMKPDGTGYLKTICGLMVFADLQDDNTPVTCERCHKKEENMK